MERLERGSMRRREEIAANAPVEGPTVPTTPQPGKHLLHDGDRGLARLDVPVRKGRQRPQVRPEQQLERARIATADPLDPITVVGYEREPGSAARQCVYRTQRRWSVGPEPVVTEEPTLHAAPTMVRRAEVSPARHRPRSPPRRRDASQSGTRRLAPPLRVRPQRRECKAILAICKDFFYRLPTSGRFARIGSARLSTAI